jgi:hypothetical protein
MFLLLRLVCGVAGLATFLAPVPRLPFVSRAPVQTPTGQAA